MPRTLLQLSGADLAPARLDHAVLLLIDVQNDYVDGPLALPDAQTAIDQAARLLERARAKRTPVVHVVHVGSTGGLFDPDSHGGAIVDAVRPASGEPRVLKRLPDAFAKTNLDELLRGPVGRHELIVAGFMTHMCVSTTVRQALHLGFRSTVVAAACATRALPDPLGGIIDHRALHRAALSELADRFAVVVPDESAIS